MTCLLVVVLLLASPHVTALQEIRPAAEAPPQPVLKELRLDGATVFTRDDVLFLLTLREGAPLPRPPADVAKALQERYERDGYSEARVSGAFDEGRLTLSVDEGRIDDIEILGVTPGEAARLLRRLGVKQGDVYNARVIGRASTRLTEASLGAFTIGQPRRYQPGVARGESVPDEVILDRRGPRKVLVVPLRWRTARTGWSLGSSREDLFSPVDGLSPAAGFTSTIFDHAEFNHTFVSGYVSYKFARDEPGYSFGFERPLFRGPKLFVGAELHDVTASDDLWRITSVEQTVVSVAFKNSFRDYYRRRGAQIFSVLRAGENNEITAMARWDRHEPLGNATNYSFFRDAAVYRPNPLVADQRVNALVLGYTFDTRPLSAAGQAVTYQRHLNDSLFGTSLRQAPGLRVEWTSEVAGRGLKGDAQFDRHILNTRGYLALSSHTLLSMRGLFGFSNGTLPLEREFAIGGIGSVHGYGFKEAAGTGMTLFNAEYRVNLGSTARGDRDAFGVFGFYDAGRVTSRTPSSAPSSWLRGVGVGVGGGGVRIEFGFRANDIPHSRQVLVRFSPTF
jgi:outer membrane protein assembly factor BamA